MQKCSVKTLSYLYASKTYSPLTFKHYDEDDSQTQNMLLHEMGEHDSSLE